VVGNDHCFRTDPANDKAPQQCGALSFDGLVIHGISSTCASRQWASNFALANGDTTRQSMPASASLFADARQTVAHPVEEPPNHVATLQPAQ
jgi:hypothetical protein